MSDGHTDRPLPGVRTYPGLLEEPPANLVSGIVDNDLPRLSPGTPLGAVTRYLAAYSLVCGPVVDEQSRSSAR